MPLAHSEELGVAQVTIPKRDHVTAWVGDASPSAALHFTTLPPFASLPIFIPIYSISQVRSSRGSARDEELVTSRSGLLF